MRVEDIQSTTDGALHILRMTRTKKKNALTRAMYSAMTEGLNQARDNDDVKVAVILGGEGIYCAGNDLMDFVQDPPTGPDSPVLQFLAAISTFQKPLVMAVDGPAVGIGTTMLMHADLVYASERAVFQLPFVPLGIVPEAGSSWILPRMAGLQRATEWLLFGERFTAEQAHAAGLVNEILASPEVESRALHRAQQLASLPTAAVLATKKLIRSPLADQTRETIETEARVFVERLKAPETAEAMMNFLNKK